MSNSSLFLFFSVLFPLLQNPVILTRADDKQGADLITKTCGLTMYKDLCISTLKSGKATKDSNLSELESIILLKALSLAKQASEKIVGLEQEAKDSSTKDALADCIENFHDVVSQISGSMDALGPKKYNDINTWITASMTDVDACEDLLKPKSSISEESKSIQQLCSIALSITDQLGGSEDDVATSEDEEEKKAELDL